MQAETCVLAQMQLKQHHDAAAKERNGLCSQLAAQAAAADEIAVQHTAELEACRQTVNPTSVLLQSSGFHSAQEILGFHVRSFSFMLLTVQIKAICSKGCSAACDCGHCSCESYRARFNFAS